MSDRTRTMGQGDLLPVFVVDIRDCDERVDFTGWTLTFQMRGPVMRTGAATGDDQGVVTYVWAPGDTDVPGEYGVLFVGISPAGKQQTFPVDAVLRVEPP